MIKILILALTISYALGACSNTVAAYFGLDNVQGTAATLATAAGDTCAGLVTTSVCCVAADLIKFKARTTARIAEIEAAITARDTKFLAARKALGDAKDKFAAFASALSSAQSNIDTWTTTPKSPLTATDMTSFATALTTIKNTVVKFYSDYSTLRTAYTDYQTKRQTCFQALLKAEAAAYCLACIDNTGTNLADKGVTVTGTTVTLAYGPFLKSTLGGACVPYIEASETQSIVARANYYVGTLTALTNALKDVAAGTTTGITTFTTAVTPTITDQAVATKKPAANCAAASCDLINNNIFVNGKVAQAATQTVWGGETVATRRLQSVQSRNLQNAANFFDPALTEVSYTVAVKADPSGKGNPVDLSALRVGVFSCIVAFFVALLI